MSEQKSQLKTQARLHGASQGFMLNLTLFAFQFGATGGGFGTLAKFKMEKRTLTSLNESSFFHLPHRFCCCLFQLVRCSEVLAVLNFMCLVMLVLASRAMKSEAISRLIDEQLRENEKFRSHFLTALRTSYSISILLLLLVVMIYGILSRLSRIPHPAAFVLGWSPAFFSAWALLQMLTFIRLLAALAMNKVECFYRELEASSNGMGSSPCLEAQEFAPAAPGHWLHLLREHQKLLRHLKAMSSAISATVLVFQNVVAGSSLLSLWVARAYQKDAVPSTGYVLLAFTMMCSGIFAMLPLAYITDLCQSRRLGRRSLLNLADKYSGWPMSAEVHAEYMRFMQHMNMAEAGVYLPNMGMVTRQSLTNQIMFYVKVLPLALALTLGWWRRG